MEIDTIEELEDALDEYKNESDFNRLQINKSIYLSFFILSDDDVISIN